jgi:hypothetical protein
MSYTEEADRQGLAVWYGDHELAVLVEWRSCHVVGLVR